jgi:bacterioferritin (cytochrome b1)
MRQNQAGVGFDTEADAMLVAELNQLLELDYDAAAAYTLALSALDEPGLQDAARRFKLDHERHIDDLSALILSYGGTPVVDSHIAGEFKTAVQDAGVGVDDVAVVAAFKAHEVRSRDRYRKAASRQHPADVQGVLIRAARDEQRHFDWTMRTLADLGVNTDSVADALEQMRVRRAEALEVAERRALRAMHYTRRSLRDAGPVKLAAAGLMLIGAAAVVAVIAKRR